jgi:Uma2 family endonuclease
MTHDPLSIMERAFVRGNGMAVERRLMTVEEFWEEYAGKSYELINGEVTPVSPTGSSHGIIEALTTASFVLFLRENPIGVVHTGETGFQLSPTAMRAADIAFISNEKYARITEHGKYVPFAPDLAVEIVSPYDTATEIVEKVELYLAAGTRIVLILYPDLRQIAVHYPNRTSKTLTADDTLEGEDVLSGFTVRVADLFPPEQPKKTEELPSE